MKKNKFLEFLKRTFTIMILVFSLFNIGFMKPTFAADTTKFENFYKGILQNGYLKSTISITQINNSKYQLDFLFKENITAMDYGFYLYPTVVNSLKTIDLPTSVQVDKEYAYVTSSVTTSDLDATLKKLSALPYVNLKTAEDANSGERILDITFNKDFYKTEKEKNPLIKDVFSTNTFIVKYKPYAPKYLNTTGGLYDTQGYTIYVYTDSSNTNEYIAQIHKIPTYIVICDTMSSVLNIIIPILIILLIISFIIYKKNGSRNSSRRNNRDIDEYEDNDYNEGYNNYYNDDYY